MNMSEAAKPQFTVKDPTKADPFTEYVLPLESPQKVAGDIRKAEAHTQLVVTDFAELEDGTLIELMEDPADMHHTLVAVWKDEKVEYLDELKNGDRVLKPFLRTNELLKPIRLPKGASPYRSTRALLDALEDLISRCVANPSEIYSGSS
jgi:hypothetical protein